MSNVFQLSHTENVWMKGHENDFKCRNMLPPSPVNYPIKVNGKNIAFSWFFKHFEWQFHGGFKSSYIFLCSIWCVKSHYFSVQAENARLPYSRSQSIQGGNISTLSMNITTTCSISISSRFNIWVEIFLQTEQGFMVCLSIHFTFQFV